MNKYLIIIFLSATLFFSGCIPYSSVNVNNVTITGPLDESGNLEVAIQDQTTEPIDLFLVRYLNDVTLSQNTVIDTYSFVAESGHNISVGNVICFQENKSFLQVFVTGVSGNNISINEPFDHIYTSNALVENTNPHLNVVGSPENPVVFRVSPKGLSDTSWDINWMMFHITDNVVMDDSTFGGLPKLTNGIVVRVMDGFVKNLFSVRYNGDFAHQMKSTQFVDRAPTGEYGFRAYKTFNGQDYNGVVIRLKSNTSDTFEVIVRDDLSGLLEMHATIHGQVVQK